jgi:hypothetical protein
MNDSRNTIPVPTQVTMAYGEYDDSGTFWDAATRYLCARMSEISEDAWFAGWLTGLEFTLWHVAETDTTDGRICELEARSIVNMARELRCWWVWGDDGPTRLSLGEWLPMYEAWRTR